ncbi:class A beta-lactamase [Aureimonas sp. ME7]|uniref:class A beta-lactamase n=1 Tax=Aureimonas sp. ME7 TaxID=2744252 RepID=UPI0015F5449C|nr:class A beta-lactamase [Aureimonas sp. ME7]
MTTLLTRRGFAALSLALVAGLPARSAFAAFDGLEALFAEIEREIGGRLGAYVRDTGTGASASHRPDERFPLNSTFKALAAGAVLARVDKGEEDLDRLVAYEASDLVTYSPVTEKHAGKGMTLAALCEATVTLSDNTAGNLVLRSLGGPEGLTRYLGSIGDGVTRLDRWETELNEGRPGDERDTTSPRAAAATLERLLLGGALSARSAEQLGAWLRYAKTGDAKLRAGVPKSWAVGDKTGSGGNGSANILAVLYPPGGRPIVVALYFTGSQAPMDAKNEAMKRIAQTIATT